MAHLKVHEENDMSACVDCGNELQWLWEAQQGNLCSLCGPGSVKWQEKQAQAAKQPERKLPQIVPSHLLENKE